MATVLATINWPPVPGSLGYLIEYKERTSSVWITPGPGNPTLATTFNITINDNTLYDLRISSKCASGGSTYRQTTMIYPPGPSTVWITNTYTCAQDSVFTPVSSVTGLSSPISLYYDAVTSMYYVADQDSVLGHVWKFNPATFAAPGDAIYIPGFSGDQCYVNAIDRQYKRIYLAGRTTNGLKSLDIATETYTDVAYGSNVDFSRTLLYVLDNNIYCGDTDDQTITIIDRALLTVTNTVNVATIPDQGGRKLSTASQIQSVNGELWVTEDGRASSTNNYILRYSNDLTTLNGFIDISAFRTIWQDSTYWGKSFYDQSKNRFYLGDVGSSTLILVDTTSNTIIDTITITNREGKPGCYFSFVQDPITQELFVTAIMSTAGSDPSPLPRTYRINRDTFVIEEVYPQTGFTVLEREGNTNFLWGAFPGQPRWNGGSWDTDGIITKFSR